MPVGNRTLLVIGAAGGAGSITIQLAKRVASMTVIATASRSETRAWVEAMGADYVVDHSRPLAPQVAALGIGAPGFVYATTQTSHHFHDILELIAPQGRLGVISGVGEATHPDPLSGKSVTLCYELMFTRSNFETPDMIEQHKLLSEAARLVDGGILRTTRTEHFGRITAENLTRAHAAIETGRTIGKIVLEGF